MPQHIAARPSRAVHVRPERPPVRRWRGWLVALGLVPALGIAQTTATPAPAPAQINRSAMDGVLFYQLLVSELELRQGDAGLAFQVMLEAARRSREESLFRRAVDIAIGARAGEQAATALKAWRQALPKSRAAAELDTQMLMALGRHQDAREPLNAFIDLTPVAERAAAIASLPRLVLSGAKPEDAAQAIDDVLKPWRAKAPTRLSALTATAGAWITAGQRERSLALTREAHALDPSHQPAALLALELMKDTPAAESIVTGYLATPQSSSGVRAAYVRRLTTSQRYGDALREATRLTAGDPDLATGWLMQGALQIELGQPAAAQVSLKRFLAIKDTAPPATAGASNDEPTDRADDDLLAAMQRNEAQERAQAYLMLSQTAEQLKDYPGALQWLEQLASQPGATGTSSVLQRRASLLMRQGRLPEARTLLQQMPQTTPDETRARFMAEAQLLRDAREWPAAHTLLVQANAQLPDDADLLYEQALLAEKLLRFDEMETLLRRVIALKPDQQHAYNALGYSLADRNVRLPEARTLIEKALSFTPGDPFITDSLGWVEFRLGRLQDAARLLGDAYRQRPDVEIGTHLGEVLWAMGRQDDARQVWREAQTRDAGNEVLAETLKRLKVRP
jgi:tetratricopeptide (TPR) repeat protein